MELWGHSSVHINNRLFDLLPGRMRKMALFAVNTGLRERSLINLHWSWEIENDTLGESVFEIPGKFMKNGRPMTLPLNRLARQVIESMRGYHHDFVFGKVHQMTNNSWTKAWREAGLPNGAEYVKGVHNLRHTFGKRLRDAGVDERDIQDLLHHVPRNVTRLYSAPELRHLRACVEHIVPKPSLQTVGQWAQSGPMTSSAPPAQL